MPPTSGEVMVGQEPVRVLRAGSGRPVLLLHGSGPGTTAAGAWTTTAEWLAPHFAVVAPDQAGFGGTPFPADLPVGLETWRDRAAALMAALGHESYSVVGHSMGGAVALGLAARHPGRVTRVVAVSSMGAPGTPLSPDLDAVWGAAGDRAGAEDMLRRLVHDQALVTDAAVEARHSAIVDGASAYAGLFPAPRARWSAALELSPEALRSISAPVLLVHGAQDRLTPLASAALPLLDHLADVRMHVLGACGHAPFLEHPAEFHSVLLDFLHGTAST